MSRSTLDSSSFNGGSRCYPIHFDIRLREKTLWRFRYESAGRAEGILTLDIADLELPAA
ncbi:MAG TPA: hypothetical protein VLL08_16930 [Kineosporiaceae bacterium]|nr:hypothetical protein [Kineosporiaceae bacterium]